jgi:hypothetical protein
MRGVPFILVAFATLEIAGAAWTWDRTGHEQIADIAWTRLNDRAKAEIKLILAGAADRPFQPSHDTEASTRSAFRKAATFPDYIRTHTDTGYEGQIDAMNALFQPRPDPHDLDKELFRCRTWHYYDKPIRFTGGEPSVRTSNALKALLNALAELNRLEGTTSPDRRLQYWWLAWVEHLTGDLHQPLHCTSSFAQPHPEGDAGGNKFKLGLPNPQHPREKMALHFLWDAGIGDARRRDRDEQGLMNRVDVVTQRWTTDPSLSSLMTAATDPDPKHWIDAGAQLADQVVYVGIQEGSIPAAQYERSRKDTSRRQAVLAGWRLANLLNSALGGSP